MGDDIWHSVGGGVWVEEIAVFRISWEGGVGWVGSDIGWDVEFPSLVCVRSGTSRCAWDFRGGLWVPEAEFGDDMGDLDA